jgi:hypothetical protein
MVEEGNWKELMEEDHGVVLRLFGLYYPDRWVAKPKERFGRTGSATKARDS